MQNTFSNLQSLHTLRDLGVQIALDDFGTGYRLMGFGHRVYKNYDPRAKLVKESADEVLRPTSGRRWGRRACVWHRPPRRRTPTAP